MGRDRTSVQTLAMLVALTFVLVGVLGFMLSADWIPANDADNWLHLVLGVGLLGLGFVSTRSTGSSRAQMT